MDKTKQSIVAFGAHPDDVEIGMGVQLPNLQGMVTTYIW
jgi:LmbE family N-acetylglucosaminyl deacetylase